MNSTAQHEMCRRRPLRVVLTALCLFVAPMLGGLTTAQPAGAATVTSPGSIQIGDDVTGQLAVPLSQDHYSLLVKAPGASVALQITDSSCACSWVVSGRTGNLIGSTQTNVGATWLPAGSYTVTVTDGTPGPYAFKLWMVPNPQSFAISVPALVSNGHPAVGAGNLESPGAQDRYTFTVGVGGQRIYLHRIAGCSCSWSLKSSSGSYQYGFVATVMGDVGPTWMAAGTYVLTVSGGGGPVVGTYAFGLSVPSAQSFAISVGDTVSNGVPAAGAGNIESVGSEDRYTLSVGSGGARVYAQGLTNGCGCSWSLRSSGGSYQYGFAQQGMSAVNPTWMAPGTYVLTVSGGGVSTGTYSFTLWGVPDPQSFAISVGDSVSNGVPAAGAGNIESPGAQDRYTFTVGAGGQRISLLNDGGCNCYWSLRSSSGSYQYGFVQQGVGFVGPTWMAAGTYVLTVSWAGVSTGTYSFTLSAGSAVQSFAIAVGDTVSDGAPALGAGNIESPGAQDRYTFTVGAGGQRIYLQNLGGCCYWSLRSSGGSYQYGFAQQGMGDVGPTWIAAGTYVLTVSGSGAGMGTYAFKLWAVPNPQSFAISVGDSVSNGVPAVGAGNIESVGAQDRYTFTVGAGGQRVYLQDLGGCCYWSLRSSGGSYQYGFAQQGMGDVGPTWMAAGTYVLTVSTSGANPGTYAFKLWAVPNPQSFAISVGDSVSDGVPAVGAGNIESPGAQDRYTFTVGAGGQRIFLQNPGAGCCYWSLRSSGGSYQYGFAQQGMGDVGPTWMAAGTYVLTVSTSGANPGTYAFTVLAVPNPQAFAIAVGDTVSNGSPASGAGNIESAGAQDRYTFTVGAGGQRVYLQDLGAGCCYWSLRSSGGSYQYGFAQQGMGDVGPTWMAAGTYVLTVSGSGASTGLYSFTLWGVPNPQSFAVSIGGSVSNGVPAAGAGNIESPGAQDRYTFNAAGGTRIQILGSSCATSPSFVLATPSGRQIVNDSLCGSNDIVTLPNETGQYLLRVSGGVTNLGTYSFQIVTTTATATVTLAPADAFSIAVGDTVSNGVPAAGAGNLESSGVVDTYGFSGNSGQVVRITSPGPGCCVMYLQVFAPDGSVLGFEWIGNDSSQQFVLPQSGRYMIQTSSYLGGTGAYAFSLTADPQTYDAFNIAVGDSVSEGVPGAGAGSVEALGSVDSYGFSGTSGQVVRITSTSTPACCNLYWQVFAPDGSPLGFPWYGNTSGQPLVLPQTGTYTIQVAGYSGAQIGTYDFSLIADPQTYDTFNIAVGDSVSDGVPGAGAGNIEAAGSVDSYGFSGTAGQVVRITSPSPTACCDPYWQVFAPDGSSLGFYWWWWYGYTGGQQFVLPQTGTYTIQVAGSSATGAYGFSLIADPQTYDTFSIAVGDSVSDGVPGAGAGNIEAAGSVDSYGFSGTAGQVVRLVDPSSTGCCGLQWRVFAPDGSQIGSQYFGNSSGQQFVLSQTGLYTIQVFGYSGVEIGTYGFSLIADPQTYDTFNIAVGDSVSDGAPGAGAGNIEAAGSVDSYRFGGTAGQVVRLVDPGSSACCSLYWQVLAPDGTSLGSQYFGNTNGQQFVLPQTGTYTIQVFGISGTQIGTYGFSLTADPQTYDTFNIAVGDSVSDGAPGAGAGNIETAGSVDAYGFSGTAGQVVSFNDPGSAACCGLYWQVFAPDGTSLGSQYFGNSNGQQFVLPQTGTYSIQVVGISGTGTGTYGFSLTALPQTYDAFSIAVGDSVSDGVPGAGAGNIEAAGSVDAYGFSGTAGQVVSFNDPGSAACCGLQWQLFAPDGSSLGSQYFGNTNGQQFVLPQTGTYSIQVVGISGTQTGTYGFSLTALPQAYDTFSIAVGDSVSDGVPATGAGNLETNRSVDAYTFSGAAGQTVSFNDPGSTACCNLQWQVFEPDGTTLGTQSFQSGLPAQIFVLPQTGTYTVVVSGASGSTGTYAFSLTSVPTHDVFTIALGASVSNGVPAVGAGNIEAAGSVDAYTFSGAEGQTVSFNDPGSVACCTMQWQLLGPTGTPISTQYFDTGLSAQLVVLPQTGTYTIVVFGAGASTGPYAFSLTAVPGAPSTPTVSARNRAVALSWAAPTSNGGLAVSDYRVSVFDAVGGAPTGVLGATVRNVGSATTSYTFAGLTNGTSYSFQVSGVNALGAGVPSIRSAAAVPTATLQIAAGDMHSCALLPDKSARCWGTNSAGQLGSGGTPASQSSPVTVSGLAGGSAVTSGTSHTCALLLLGTVKCWGLNASGQLGNNSLVSSNVPVAVSGLSGVKAISAGGSHTCALLAVGTVKCWGSNASGQLGNNSLTSSKVPVVVSGLSGVKAISVGGSHTCALLTTGTVKCWGSNASGQLGNNSLTSSKVPVSVSALSGVTAISAGGSHTCALLSVGTVRCWGSNASGQLGNNSLTSSKVPVSVSALTGVKAISAGGSHSLARLFTGGVRSWGANLSGQLGNGSNVGSQVPVKVNTLN